MNKKKSHALALQALAGELVMLEYQVSHLSRQMQELIPKLTALQTDLKNNREKINELRNRC